MDRHRRWARPLRIDVYREDPVALRLREFNGRPVFRVEAHYQADVSGALTLTTQIGG